MSKWALINKETGEIKDRKSADIRDRAYVEKKARENREGRRRGFTNANMPYLSEVYNVLTTPQCGYLTLLQCYIGWDEGVIVNPDKSPMSTADMRSVLQLTGSKASTFYDFFRACIDNGFIIEKDDGAYAVNKRYHFKGTLDSNYAVKTYSAKVKRAYREVKANDIGLIYRMLPFVHMSTNALCSDPFEKDPRKIKWFTQKELADAIGVRPQTLRRRLPLMKFDGEYVVARIRLGRNPERYTLNPNVFYRQDSDPDKSLVAMFNAD